MLQILTLEDILNIREGGYSLKACLSKDTVYESEELKALVTKWIQGAQMLEEADRALEILAKQKGPTTHG